MITIGSELPPVKARALDTLLPATAASSGVMLVLTITLPWTSAVGGTKLSLALKSGNFGGEDFFAKALAYAP